MPSSRRAATVSGEASGSAPGCKAEQGCAHLATWRGRCGTGTLWEDRPLGIQERRAPRGRTVERGQAPAYSRTTGSQACCSNPCPSTWALCVRFCVREGSLPGPCFTGNESLDGMVQPRSHPPPSPPPHPTPTPLGAAFCCQLFFHESSTTGQGLMGIAPASCTGAPEAQLHKRLLAQGVDIFLFRKVIPSPLPHRKCVPTLS